MTSTTVRHFATVDAAGKASAFTVDNQIIDYIEPARTFGAGDLAEVTASRRYQPTVIAIPDRRLAAVGPMVLTLGNSERLQLVRRAAGAGAANWETTALVAGRVTAFAAAWTAQDAITVAVAVDSGEAGGRSRILIAYDLSSRTTDWSQISWIDHGCRDRLVVDGMRVVREADGTWMTLMSAGGGVLKNTYVIRRDRPASFQDHGLVYSTATDVVDIADFQLGALREGAALHVLGTNHRGARTLLSRKVPVVAAGGMPAPTPVLTFKCPEHANRLALGLAQRRGADLYVGGSGVWRLAAADFGRQENAEFQQVIAPAVADGIEHVVVAEAADGAATVWALDGRGRMVMASRRAGQAGWDSALPLRTGVREIAPVAGDGQLTSSVLVVYRTGRATHMWRDAQGIWQEEAIAVADPAGASRLVTFQTVVTLRDDVDFPRAGATVRIGASIASTLVINGHSHFVGPGNDAVIETPFDGRIVMVNRALSFSPATYRLTVDGWPRAVDISPAAVLYARFETLSVQELRNARKTDGTPLVGDASPGTLDAVLRALRQAAALGRGDGVQLVEARAPISSRVEAASLPNGYCWGLAADGRGGVKALGSADADRLAGRAGGASAGGLDIGLSLSDFWEALCDGVSDAVSFVIRKVDDVVEFVCDIGQQVGRFIVQTIEEIGAFFKTVWEKIKAKAEDVWNFLKFVFDWDDIVAVRNKLRGIVSDQLKDMHGQILGLKDKVGGAFDEGLKAVRDLAASEGLSLSAEALRRPGDRTQAMGGQSGGAAAKSVLSGGPGSWIMDRLADISNALVTIDLPPTLGSGASLEALLSRQFERMLDLCTTLGNDFQQIFGGEWPSAKDLDFNRMRQIIVAVSARIAESAIAAAKDLTLALIDALAGLVDLFQQIMFATVRIPLLEALWELIGGNKTDLSFTLIDAVLLPTAVLTTIAFKVIMPDATIGKALAVSLPRGGSHGAISSGDTAALYLTLGLAANFVTVISIFLDIHEAAAEKIVKRRSWFSVFAMVGRVALHGIVMVKLATLKNPTVSLLEWLIWIVGVGELALRGAKVIACFDSKVEATSYEILIKNSAASEVVFNVLKALFKTAAWAIDPDAYMVSEVLVFYDAATARVLVAGARLTDNPKAKFVMTVVGGGLAMWGVGALGFAHFLLAAGHQHKTAPSR